MRFPQTLLAIYILTLCGCSKPSGITTTFHEVAYDPGLGLNTVTEEFDHPSGCGVVYLPADTTAAIAVDVNGDGTADYELRSTHWYDLVSASGPCANYNRVHDLVGLHDTCRVAMEGMWYEAQHFYADDVVGTAQYYTPAANLLLDVYSAGSGGNFLQGTAHLGIRTGTSGNYHYGWILVTRDGPELTVHGHAWCEQVNQPVPIP